MNINTVKTIVVSVFSAVTAIGRAVGVNTSKNRLVGDPLFQDAANGNYRLRVQSPCRNAAWGKPTTAVDLDGKRRVVGRHMDLGCYECDLPVGTMILVR